jgi:hypothetical protein
MRYEINESHAIRKAMMPRWVALLEKPKSDPTGAGRTGQTPTVLYYRRSINIKHTWIRKMFRLNGTLFPIFFKVM